MNFFPESQIPTLINPLESEADLTSIKNWFLPPRKHQVCLN
jgi:hypothetical protein